MWPHLLTMSIGVWLIAAPSVLGVEGRAADSAHILGPLIASVGLMAASDILRGLRWCQLPLGALMMVSAFVFSQPTSGRINAAVSGAAVIGLCLIKGRVKRRFGGGWASLLKSHRNELMHSAERPTS